MAPNFSKNAILVGTVDYFCLVCETHLKSERDTDAHISKPVHQKLLEAIQYVEEFKAEGIKKIKDKYFCELCNKILSMQPRVRLHITEQPHVDNKNKNSFKRVGNYVIAFENVAIRDQSWNGLNENSCAVCNIEYENEEIHRNQPTHILNVIQIQVEFDSDHNIYRKIDEYSVHCLTCNALLGTSSLTSHVGREEHKKLYQACCDANKDLITKSETIKNDSTKVEPKLIQNDKVDSSTPKVKINNLNSSSNSRKVEEDIPISVYDENEEAICKTLGCVNYVTRDEANRLWCILCDNVMGNTNINYHINEKHHQTILKLHKKRLHKMKTNNIDCKEDKKEVVKEDEQDSSKKDSDEILEKLDDFQKCKEDKKEVVKEDEQDNSKKDSDEILEKLDNFQKDDIRINFESNIAFCKKCSRHIEFVCEAIEMHVLEHKQNETKSKTFDLKVTDTKKTLFTSPVRIKRNNNEGNKNVTPIKNGKSKKNETTVVNETPIKNETSNTKAENLISDKTTKPSTVTLNNDKENIPKNSETKETKSIDTIRVSSPKPKKPKAVKLLRVPLRMFIRNCEAVEHMMFKDIIINEKYCINFLSFCYLLQLGTDMFKCQVCEVYIQAFQFDEHMGTPRHAAAMQDTPVILNDDTEFLREIHPGSFQCGFCNWIETSWEDMTTHLKSSTHKESKNAATWRKGLYAGSIERHPDILRVDNMVMDALINQFL